MSPGPSCHAITYSAPEARSPVAGRAPRNHSRLSQPLPHLVVAWLRSSPVEGATSSCLSTSTGAQHTAVHSSTLQGPRASCLPTFTAAQLTAAQQHSNSSSSSIIAVVYLKSEGTTGSTLTACCCTLYIPHRYISMLCTAAVQTADSNNILQIGIFVFLEKRQKDRRKPINDRTSIAGLLYVYMIRTIVWK